MKEETKKMIRNELEEIKGDFSNKSNNDSQILEELKYRITRILDAHTSANFAKEKILERIKNIRNRTEEVNAKLEREIINLENQVQTDINTEGEKTPLSSYAIDDIREQESQDNRLYLRERSTNGQFKSLIKELTALSEGPIVDFYGKEVPQAELQTMQGQIAKLIKEADEWIDQDYDQQERLFNRISSFIKDTNRIFEQEKERARLEQQEQELNNQQPNETSVTQLFDEESYSKKEEAMRQAVGAINKATEATKEQTEAIEQFTKEYVQSKKNDVLAFVMQALTDQNAVKEPINIPSSKGNISGLKLSSPSDSTKGVMISTMAMASLFSKAFDRNILSFDQTGNAYYILKDEIISLAKGLKEAQLGSIADFDQESLDLLKQKQIERGEDNRSKAESIYD